MVYNIFPPKTCLPYIFPLFFLLYWQNFSLTQSKSWERRKKRNFCMRDHHGRSMLLWKQSLCSHLIDIIEPWKKILFMRICGYFNSVDPPMCERSREIIPGLLRRIREIEAWANRESKIEVSLACSVLLVGVDSYLVPKGYGGAQ